MACSAPLTAWRSAVVNESGRRSLVFDKRLAWSPVEIKVPCGRCIRCKLQRASDWSVRCMHEAKLYDDNCFVTLTYDNSNLPSGNTLVVKDFQDFMKRLRQFSVRSRGRSLRFYMCGEYGERFLRPHYHAVLFDFDFRDKKHYRNSLAGYPVYKSETLERLWGNGLCEIGSVTHDSAGYVARYCTKVITGEKADAHYGGRKPEFSLQSQGIGRAWLQRFHGDVYSEDFVLAKGIKMRPPRFYDNCFELLYPDEFERIRKDRKARRVKRDEGFRRYVAREEVTMAKLGLYGRRSL